MRVCVCRKGLPLIVVAGGGGVRSLSTHVAAARRRPSEGSENVAYFEHGKGRPPGKEREIIKAKGGFPGEGNTVQG